MILYLLNLADLVSTLISISYGLVEMNPFMALCLYIHPVVFAVIKLAAYPLCRWLERKSKAYPYLVGAFAATVWWNIVNYIYFLEVLT